MKETWKEMAVRLMDECGICPKQESLDLIALNEALKIMDGKCTKEQIIEKVVPCLTVAVINKIYYESEFDPTIIIRFISFKTIFNTINPNLIV